MAPQVRKNWQEACLAGWCCVEREGDQVCVCGLAEEVGGSRKEST